MEWIKGEPPEAMWCWATYINNDNPIGPEPDVAFLWFNPSARGNWWKGKPGIVKNFDFKITHWMRHIEKPVPTKSQSTTLPQPGEIRMLKIGDDNHVYIKAGGSEWLKPEDAFGILGDFDMVFKVNLP